MKFESCGVCHSDLHLRNGDEHLSDDLYPLILGHEGIGRIVAIGADTDSNPSIGGDVTLFWLKE